MKLLLQDPKFITQLTEKLRYEAMVQELDDERFAKSDDASRRIMSCMRQEIDHLTNIILTGNLDAEKNEYRERLQSKDDAITEGKCKIHELEATIRKLQQEKSHAIQGNQNKKRKISGYIAERSEKQRQHKEKC